MASIYMVLNLKHKHLNFFGF